MRDQRSEVRDQKRHAKKDISRRQRWSTRRRGEKISHAEAQSTQRSRSFLSAETTADKKERSLFSVTPRLCGEITRFVLDLFLPFDVERSMFNVDGLIKSRHSGAGRNPDNLQGLENTGSRPSPG
jgi:hypothetical protein